MNPSRRPYNFDNGKPTDAFKRRSSLYKLVIRPDGTSHYKFNEKLLQQKTNK